MTQHRCQWEMLTFSYVHDFFKLAIVVDAAVKLFVRICLTEETAP